MKSRAFKIAIVGTFFMVGCSSSKAPAMVTSGKGGVSIDKN